MTIRHPNRDHIRPPDDCRAVSPDGGFAEVDELIASGGASPTPDRETTDGREAPSSPVPEGSVPIGSLLFADELPDGVVVADQLARLIVFNRVPARLTGTDPAEVTCKFVFDVL